MKPFKGKTGSHIQPSIHTHASKQKIADHCQNKYDIQKASTVIPLFTAFTVTLKVRRFQLKFHNRSASASSIGTSLICFKLQLSK